MPLILKSSHSSNMASIGKTLYLRLMCLPTDPSQPSQQPHEVGMIYCPVVTLRYKLQQTAQLIRGILFFLYQKEPLPKLGLDNL